MTTLLGRTTAGTTADGFPAGDYASWKFTAVASGSATLLKFQTKVANPGLTLCELGIYDNSGGGLVPGAKLGSANAASITGTGVMTATLGTPVTIVSGTVYWLAVRPVGEQFDWQGDAVAATTAAGGYNEPTGASFPSTWPSGWPTWGTTAIIWAESSSAQTLSRTASESVSVSDSLARGAQALSRTATESTSISDDAQKTDALSRTAAESVGAVTDSSTGIAGPIRTASESVTGPSDSVARSAQAILRAITESVAISDAVLGVKTFTRAVTESISGPTDAAVRVVSFSRTTLDPGGIIGPWFLVQVTSPTNTIAISDAAIGLAGKGRTASESITLSEALTRGLTLSRAVTESLLLVVDSLHKTDARARTAAESVTLSEALARLASLPRAVTELLVVDDLLARSALDFARTASESIMFFEELDSSSTGATSRSVSELVLISDAANRAPLTFDRALDLTGIAVDDAVLGGNLQNVTASESWAVSDDVARTAAIVRLLGASLTVSDAIGTHGVFQRLVDEAISVDDEAILGAPSPNREASEFFSVGDSAVRVIGLIRSASEVLVVFDTMGRPVYGVRPVGLLVASSAPASFGAGSLTSRPA